MNAGTVSLKDGITQMEALRVQTVSKLSNQKGGREKLDEMLPQIANEKLADYIDVFCETGFFSPEETEIIFAGATTGIE